MSDTLDRLEQDITVLFERDVPGPEWDDAWGRVTTGLAFTLPGLVAVARAAERHLEDCCRTDISLLKALRSHDALVSSLVDLDAHQKDSP